MTLFQSTPTGFPAGDSCWHGLFPATYCFNPRRPVSRPATRRRGRSVCSAGCFNPRRPVSRPATWLPRTRDNSIDSFNPRRPVSRPATVEGVEAVAVHVVSIHADRFPGRRRPWRAELRRRACGFNPRRPVSRPATSMVSGIRMVTSGFQSTPTGFPAGDDAFCASADE